MDSHQDVHPIRDTYGAYPADMHAFFPSLCEARRYKLQEIIGRGSYGVVCSAFDTRTGEKVAIKKIQNVFDNVPDATRILREIKLLRELKHPDVVEIKHIMLPEDPRHFKDIYVVFELFESDLHTVINANDDLTQDHHKVFLYQLLRGLNFIHASGVLHRDLKPKNILANANCKLKICDFGLARPTLPNQGDTPVYWTDYVATRWYRAPELCGCFYGKYSEGVDVWGLGCIFAEVLTGKPLFPGRDAVSQLTLITDLLGKPSAAVIARITNSKARAFLTQLPPKAARSFESKFPMADPLARDLLRRLLAFDPKDRPTAGSALTHPYFAGLPYAVCENVVGVSAPSFKFESQRLTEVDVRQLIFKEILAYHPHVMAMYEQRAGRPVHYAPSGTGDELKCQFMRAEEQQQMAAASSSSHTARAEQYRAMMTQQQYAAGGTNGSSGGGAWGSQGGASSSSGGGSAAPAIAAVEAAQAMMMQQSPAASLASLPQHYSPSGPLIPPAVLPPHAHHEQQHLHYHHHGGGGAAAALFGEILPQDDAYMMLPPAEDSEELPTQLYSSGPPTQPYGAYTGHVPGLFP